MLLTSAIGCDHFSRPACRCRSDGHCSDESEEFTEYALRRGDGTMDIRSLGGTEHLYPVEQWARDQHTRSAPGIPAPGRGSPTMRAPTMAPGSLVTTGVRQFAKRG
jgi:hypothetical protein